ncbi:MAG: hypothetical protein AABX25_03225 [Nanoarchaeota archaeon]
MKLKIILLALMLVLFALPVFANPEENGINIPALALDFVLIGGIAVIYFGSVFAGELKTAFNYVFAGIAIFSIDHLVETIMLALGVGLDANEITHRVIHLAGFAFLLYGFYRVRKVVTSLEAKGQKKMNNKKG